MREALQEARDARQEGEVPVGAILVNRKGEIVARNHNRTEQLNDPTAHAEVLTIREAARRVKNYRLNGMILYVTKEPCLMCSGAGVWARIKRVVFGAFDPQGGAADLASQLARQKKLNHKIEIKGGVLKKECKNLLKNYFKSKRKPGKLGRRYPQKKQDFYY